MTDNRKTNTVPDNERRSGKDRRATHIPFFKLLFFSGKRKNLRRKEDSGRITVFDTYHPKLLFSILFVLVLSLLDATLTLILIERGAVEINPIMKYYITLGPVVFVIVKYGITALALILILIIHTVIVPRYRIGSLLLPFCGMVFGSVVIWELYLLAR
jgi:hypothetical protein